MIIEGRQTGGEKERNKKGGSPGRKPAKARRDGNLEEERQTVKDTVKREEDWQERSGLEIKSKNIRKLRDKERGRGSAERRKKEGIKGEKSEEDLGDVGQGLHKLL